MIGKKDFIMKYLHKKRAYYKIREEEAIFSERLVFFHKKIYNLYKCKEGGVLWG